MGHVLLVFIIIMIIITAPIWVPVLIIALLHGLALCAQIIGALIIIALNVLGG